MTYTFVVTLFIFAINSPIDVHLRDFNTRSACEQHLIEYDNYHQSHLKELNIPRTRSNIRDLKCIEEQL